MSPTGLMSKAVDTTHPRPLPQLIFDSRWLQLPLYIGLIVAQGVVLFLKELWHLLTYATSFNEQQIMLLVLTLIDVVMISNLLVIVIVGGCVTTPTVLVGCGAVETTGSEVAGSEFFSSSVAASATTAPETRATRRSAASAAQSQRGESRLQISAYLPPTYAPGRRRPHSRQYSW